MGLARRGVRSLAIGRFLAVTLVAALLWIAPAAPASADDYNEDRVGHPVRVLAYLTHPVGVILDYVFYRPFHWVGSKEPFKTLFGHRDEFGTY